MEEMLAGSSKPPTLKGRRLRKPLQIVTSYELDNSINIVRTEQTKAINTINQTQIFYRVELDPRPVSDQTTLSNETKTE